MTKQPNNNVKIYDETSPDCTPQILTPENDSDEIANNICLLDTYLNARGLEFPAVVLYKGVYHPFDFYCANKECVIKILHYFDVEEMEQLMALSEMVDMIVLIDGDDAACGKCNGCAEDDLCDQVMAVGKKIGAYIIEDDVIYAYDESREDWDQAAA